MGHIKKPPVAKTSTKEKLREKQKAAKKIRAKMRARLIVRNLPFKTTEEDLKKHFEPFGEVLEVTLLRKPDGKLMGCGFVQFNKVQKAVKARFHLNGKPFLDRNIACDFAIAKDKYNKIREGGGVKDETHSEENEDKPELVDNDEDKSETAMEEEVKIDSGDDSETQQKSEIESEEENEGDDSDRSSQASDDSQDTSDLSVQESTVSEKTKRVSNDVVEGKTVFVKNIPFDATNEDLKECMKQFGPIYYALICFDKFTEHSKGTAFVKFVNKEDAEKCLSAGTELTLLGTVIDCHQALEKNDLIKMEKEKRDKKAEPKDSRNLYLVKEGVILAGSKAAQGVSGADMAKRLQLEQYKTQMLRKLNMFVSRERLIVHNLPLTWDDKKLRTLFLKHGGKGAVVKEARIMRDMKNPDKNGVGASKGYGFVAFTKHESALTALRKLNNNPNIFSSNNRPIVAFSIENRSMINAKLKQQHNSQLKNANSKKLGPRRTGNNEQKTDDAGNALERENLQKFSGVTAKRGINKMRSKFKLKTQAELHHQNLKLQKRRRKFAKKTLEEKKKDFIRQPRQKIGKGRASSKDFDNFSKMVGEYKKLLGAPAKVKNAKWYET